MIQTAGGGLFAGVVDELDVPDLHAVMMRAYTGRIRREAQIRASAVAIHRDPWQALAGVLATEAKLWDAVAEAMAGD